MCESQPKDSRQLAADRTRLGDRCVVFPRTLDDRRAQLVTQSLRFFPGVCADPRGIAAGCTQHAQLQRGTLLEKAGRNRSGADIAGCRGDAVTTHHDRHLVSETFGETIAELACANQADAVVLGDAVDESATLVVNDPVRLSDLRQCDASWWMSMNDTPELGTRRVRACMDPELAVRRAGARHNVPI